MSPMKAPIRMHEERCHTSAYSSASNSSTEFVPQQCKPLSEEFNGPDKAGSSSEQLSTTPTSVAVAIDPTCLDKKCVTAKAFWPAASTKAPQQPPTQEPVQQSLPAPPVDDRFRRPKIADSILDLIGNTPMVKLSKIVDSEQPCAEIVAKLESNNPSNSVKDRIAYSMIKEAEKRGEIRPHHTTLVEPTSGNTGIGLSMVAARLGYRLILTMPEGMSMEKRVLLQAFGAEVVLTRNEDGMAGTIQKAEEIVESLGSDRAFLLQQFNNPDNPKVHRETTGPEIYHDTDGDIDILIAGVGTGGTLTGCAQYLKPLLPNLKVIAVEPSESPVLSGGAPGPHCIQGIGAGVIPDNVDLDLIDEVVPVSSDEAMFMSRQLVQREGVFCGISSGAAVHAALKVGRRPENVGKRIVVFIPSFGERYLSTVLFQDLWEEAANMKAETSSR